MSTTKVNEKQLPGVGTGLAVYSTSTDTLSDQGPSWDPTTAFTWGEQF